MKMLRSAIVCLGLLLGPWFYAGAATAADAAGNTPPPIKTREQLFLEVFKRAPVNVPVSSYVAVMVDGVLQQKVKAVLPQGEQDILLESKPVLGFLSQVLRSEIVQRLEGKIDGQGWINGAALDEAGLLTLFDLRKFEFSINTAPEMRETRIRYLNQPMLDPLSVDAIRPAPVSAFLNFNLKGVARRDTAASAALEQTELGFAADGALNLHGVVLEGSAFAKSGAKNALHRGDVRMVYDQPQRALRYSAGDLRYPVVGYQSLVTMGGVGVAKDFSLQPHVPTYRTGQFEFYLESPAEVKIWVNESLVNTLQLPAGTHDIRGLTPAIGANDIRLVIEDSAGRRQTLHFSFIYNPILLDKGRSLYSYNAGFLRELKDGAYAYDTKQPVVSASYLQGVTDATTLGAYIQADTARTLLGVKALHVLSIGTLQLDAAANRSDDARWDKAAKVELTSTPAANGRPQIQSQASVEYLGKDFGAINTFAPAPGNVLNFVASLAAPLGNGITAQINGSYSRTHAQGLVDAYGASARLSRRWGKYTTGSMALRQRRSIDGETQTELLFGISFSYAAGTSSVYVAKELESDAITSRWDSGRPGNASAPYAFASTRLGPDQRELIGGGGYWGNQGQVEASHTRTEIRQAAGGSDRDETTLRLQSALVFADSKFAFARPVAENFVIVTGKDGLAAVDMKVDPDGKGGSRARSNWLSPAVLGDVASYRLRELRIEPVNPPLGVTPEKLTFSMAPTYKSGFLLTLGKELKIVAIGKLVDAKRAPLAHLAIEIRSIDRSDEKSVSTVTSRSGGFQLPDIKPGRYEIRSSSTTRWAGLTVDIPEAKDGLYRLGDLVLLPNLGFP
jgi:outer membrane usher protein